MTPEITTWISRLRRAGSWAAGRGLALAAGVAVALLLAGEIADWRRAQEPARRVVTVRPTARLANAELVRVPLDLDVPAIQGRTLARLERDYVTGPLTTVAPDGALVGSSGAVLPGGLAGAELVLGEFRLARLPDGGGALVTRDAGGGVDVRVLPEPRRFISFRPEWSVGGLVSPIGSDRDWRAYARWSGLRIGRIHAVVEGGAHGTGGRSGAYAMVGAEIRFGSQ
ncbi:MAG TPA: hypothetical protein P5144_16105 [Thermoanaerobaculia bacterium]|nr:hypothetical protein [Thermoanaerobaculia bacterium]HRU10901.1 hypothetical protein [Thermoanaerobaculia bacterium]